MKRKRIISIDVNTGHYDEFMTEVVKLGIARQSSYVCHANVHMLVEAWRNASFSKAINESDIVTPDGMPLVNALRKLHGVKQDRIEGMQFMPDLIAIAEKQSLSVFFYGSTDDVLADIYHRITRDHPNLIVAGMYSPPFKTLSEAEQKEHIDRINDSNAHIVFVGLGCPKQEIWMARNKGWINAVMVGVGGAFPVYAGRKKRAPKWMQRFSLEWLYRLFQEPGRLWKRYLATNTIFVFLMLRSQAQKMLAMVLK